MEADILADAANRKQVLAEIEANLKTVKDPAKRASFEQAALDAKELTLNEQILSTTTELGIIQQASDLLAAAQKAGKLTSKEYGALLGDLTTNNSHLTWRVFREMDRQGLIDPAIRSSLKKKLSPFDVTQHRGFDAVDKFHGPSAQKGNFNTNTGRQTKPNRVTVTEAPGEVMAANRVMDKTTPELTTSGGKVKLYQAGADDIQVARLSVARMEEMAPNLLPSLKEIHFARSTGLSLIHI